MTFTCQTPRDQLKGRDPDYNYIHFGDPEDKRDVEGKIMYCKYVRNAEGPRKGRFAEGQWGGGEFACNSLYYSLEHKMIFDFTGGWAARDAERKRLRIPVFPQMAQANPDHDEVWQQRKWCEEGTELIYRYLKFRARKYTSGSTMMELRLWRILIDAVGTEEGFIELATTLATKAGKTKEEVKTKMQSWLQIQLEDMAQLSASGTRRSRKRKEYAVGTELVLWKHAGEGQESESIVCTIEEQLGRGATATVYRVSYAGLTGALKVFEAARSADDFAHLGDTW